MKIAVALRDIAKGVPKDPARCAIAQALRRQCARYPNGGLKKVRVTEEVIQVGRHRWRPNDRVVTFMRSFDDGDGTLPGPIRFSLEDPVA